MKTKTQTHTPGPWRLETRIMSGGEKRMVIWGGTFGSGPIDVMSFPVRRGQNDEANARLIAAAPDLLEAARMVDQLRIQNSEGNIVIPVEAAKAIRSAIAKAQGDGR